KDVAMQIAAANPLYLCESEVPAEVIEKEKEILLAQISNDPKLAGKPEQVKVKMVEGKIGKYYKENCLVDQQYVKDPDITVAQYVENTGKELGGAIAVKQFVRFEKGEGLEKKSEDFAAEIASMVK
ncbi:MAG: translation elongation factor Ts, partial [Ruthenibacterium sp.]